MTPFECYKTYIAMKQHFCKDSYDYQRYGNRFPNMHIQQFYERKDRFFFEKMSREFSDKDVESFFLSNFVSDKDPEKVFMAEMIKGGRNTFIEWKKRNQALLYNFKEDANKLFEGKNINDVFDCSKGHPPLLKDYLGGRVSIETLVICDKILRFRKDFDNKLSPYVWKTVSEKIKNYEPFININVFDYKKTLKELVL